MSLNKKISNTKRKSSVIEIVWERVRKLITKINLYLCERSFFMAPSFSAGNHRTPEWVHSTLTRLVQLVDDAEKSKIQITPNVANPAELLAQ